MRLPAALLAAPLLLVGLVACGGTASPAAPAPSQAAGPTSVPTPGDPTATVRQAVERMGTQSYRYRLDITEADGPITGEGEYVPGPPVGIRESFSFTDAEYGTQTFERIAVGADQWFRAALGSTTGGAPSEDTWVKAQAFGGGSNETLGPFDIREQFPLLLVVTDLRADGEQQIDGARTVRYRGTVPAAADPTSFEVWMDDQGRLRRLARTSAGSTGVTRAEVTFRDFGDRIDVAPPPADQVAAPAPTATASTS